jgi:dihydrolipoamide dehydrogenase
MSDYDLAVLGGGPGGYAAALYGASAGLRVALVEADALGGTCLNRGCIPAKSLLHSAEVFRTATRAAEFGVVPADGNGSFTVDWARVSARTDGIVGNLVGGLSGLLRRRKVEVINGRGRLDATGRIEVAGGQLDAAAVVIATGSVPKGLPGFDVDGQRVITSDHATRADRLPERVAVIGGGVVGVEFASVYTDVGVDTTLFEALPDAVLPAGPDAELSAVVAGSLARRGARILGGARVKPPEITADGVVLGYETTEGVATIEVDQVLVATGRAPAATNLGLADAGVEVDADGFVLVDTATMGTTRPGVYAVGDVVHTPGLAHVAYAEAIVAVRAILGEAPMPVDYTRVPWVVYAHPELAWVGLTEAAAAQAGHAVEVRRYRFAGNGRAMILGETEGLVKVVAEQGGPILGVHLVGPWASELLAENQLAVNWQALPEEVGTFVHPHPSLSEAVGEAMLAFGGRSLHG